MEEGRRKRKRSEEASTYFLISCLGPQVNHMHSKVVLVLVVVAARAHSLTDFSIPGLPRGLCLLGGDSQTVEEVRRIWLLNSYL